MKKKIFILAVVSFVILSFKGVCQLNYPDQPKEGYYEDLKKKIIPVIPTQASLIAMKSESVIPTNFKDTLLKYDWYEIANYYFFDRTYNSYFLDDLETREKIQAGNQFNFTRYSSTGIEYPSSLMRSKDGSLKTSHTMFDENTAVKLVEVKKVNTKNMIVKLVYGVKETTEILSYKNGIMVLNIKQSPTATVKRFHIAYMAIPKPL
ncbi:MAG: hypothetical protein H0W73_15870 [Bacteroidetes bacterium]|nr:hypothetical protein [Bacteroidota bacterium]